MVNRLLRRAFRIFYRYQTQHKGPTLYELKSKIDSTFDTIEKWCRALVPLLAGLAFAVFIYDAGFNSFYSVDPLLYKFWRVLIILLGVPLVWLFLLDFRHTKKKRTRIFHLILILIVYAAQRLTFEVQAHSPTTNEFIFIKLGLYGATVLIFFTEVSQILRFIYRRGVNPAFLFVASFLILITIGSLLLLLPNATNGGIRPVDAWFTSASAVCVTGLTVVDTATKFTHIGKLIIIGLVQIGGLGVMTFAGLISYLAAGSVSVQNQLALRSMLSSDRFSTVIAFVTRIVIVTFFFEAIGAVVIYHTLQDEHFPNILEKIFFSAFHSISAFCNAGFSTNTNSLYELPFRYNYSLHLVISLLIILGGMGFPVLLKLFQYLQRSIFKPIYRALNMPFSPRQAHLLDYTAKLALIMTVILLAFGFGTYLLFEQDASLKGHSTTWGKVVTAFVGSVMPRTAGFNSVDMSILTLPTIMIYLLLMWIGASPGSTGGGIKTTTIAVAFLNIRSIVRGKAKTEFSSIRIGEQTMHRAFAIMVLSLVIIGLTTLILTINEPEKQLFAVAFEAFSAFSTVGLSLGITADLSITSKILLSFVMLVGRVGVLTILYALITPAKHRPYRFPKEEISL